MTPPKENCSTGNLNGGECVELQVLRVETQKDLEFQAKVLSDTLEETRECLTEVNNVHKSLVESVSAVNSSLKDQNKQLAAGNTRFDVLDGGLATLRDKMYDFNTRLVITETIAQNTPDTRQVRYQAMGFGAGAGGAVFLIAEAIYKAISLL